MSSISGAPLSVLAEAQQSLPAASGLVWVLFLLFVGVLFVIDLVFFTKKHDEPTVKSSLLQTLFFVGMACAVGVALIFFTEFGSAGGGQFFSAYISEWLMSLDNLFVIALLMTFFAVPREYQHKVLFWGIVISIIFRGGFIFGGLWLLHTLAFLGAIMGAFLVYTAYKSWTDADDEEPDPTKAPGYSLVTKIMPATKRLYGDKLFVRNVLDTNNKKRRLAATALGICVMIIGVADLVFAIDSLPVVLAITSSTFIAFSSNLLAVTGLRSVFFLFGYIGDRVNRLNQGIAVILGWIGIKMIIGNEEVMGWLHIKPLEFSTFVSLSVIVVVLALTVLASKLWPKTAAEVALDHDIVESDDIMVEVYVDASGTMFGEWNTGMIGNYLPQAVKASGRYDTDKSVPIYGFAERVAPLGDFRIDEPLTVSQPDLGADCDLAAVLRHADETARSTNGKFIFVILTDGRVGDGVTPANIREAERAASSVFTTMPNNAFVVFVRVSDEPGGSEFLDALDEYNVGDADRCETIHATDDSGAPKDTIDDEIGRELDAWVGVPA